MSQSVLNPCWFSTFKKRKFKSPASDLHSIKINFSIKSFSKIYPQFSISSNKLNKTSFERNLNALCKIPLSDDTKLEL